MFRHATFYTKRFIETCFHLRHLPRNKLLWTSVKALLTAAPASVIGYISVDFKGSEPPPGQAKLVAYLATHEPMFVGIILAPVVLMFLFELWERHTAKAETKPGTDEFAAVLKGIDDIVAVKAKAISEYASAVKLRQGKRAEAFEKVTHPETQIEQIVAQLYFAIRTITGDDDIKIVLVPIVDGVPTGEPISNPKDAMPPGNLLKEHARRTMFFYAARDNEAKVIQDIEKYLQLTSKTKLQYCPSGSEDDRGSIICVPVRHPHWDKVIYSLSLKSNVPGVFTKGNKKRYQRITEYFTKRILMEHCLQIIFDNTVP